MKRATRKRSRKPSSRPKREARSGETLSAVSKPPRLRSGRRLTPSVDVVVLDAAWRKRLPNVERVVRKAARAAVGRRGSVLVVALADDKTVHELNARHRGSNKPTNVLSYPSDARGL